MGGGVEAGDVGDEGGGGINIGEIGQRVVEIVEQLHGGEFSRRGGRGRVQ